MSAIVAVMAYEGMPSAETARAMLRAAPHRGRKHTVEIVGACAIGICNDEQSVHASIAIHHGSAAALVGNLDNRMVLGGELSRWGVQGPDDNPARVVLAAFEVWGSDAVGRFRGAFAGVVWDGDRLWCFRDQVGFQPLFYRSDERGFYCASEAKQVTAGAGLVREPDLDALEVVYYRGIGEDSAIKGVKRFLSSALAHVDRRGNLVVSRYWDPLRLLESARFRVAEARERLVGLLDQAVARVVTGNEAVTLSGGIDSPTVAAFAAPKHLRGSGRHLVAINTSYPHFPSVDETAYARHVAEYLGIPIRTHILTGTPLDDISLWTTLADGPWDTLPMPHVVQTYRFARELGVRTILTGELAEYVYTISESLLGHLLWHGRWAALASHTKALVARGASWSSVGRRMAREAMPASLRAGYARLANRRSFHIPDWVDITAVGGSRYRHDFSGSARQRWRRAQWSATRGTTSTLEADEICAAFCGVRVRRPLADIDLWEFFLSLPAEVKFPDPTPKALIRQAMRGRLPDETLDRRTKTFFDDFALGTADYPAMRRWIDPSRYRMRGVNYELLRSRLEKQSMGLTDLLWAYDLAKVHAFVSS